MSTRDLRALLNRMVRPNSSARPTPIGLMQRAGLAGGEPFEPLENRVLLGGDHPSFPSGGFDSDNPPAADVIDIDPVTGLGTISGGLPIGQITVGDDDLFKFTTPSFSSGQDFVTVRADTLNVAGGSALNSTVEIYDSTGAKIATGTNNGTLSSGTPSDGWVGFIAQAASDYFVRILADNGAPPPTNAGGYVVRVDAKSTALTVDSAEGTAGSQGTLDAADLGMDIVFQVDSGSDAEFDSLATAVATETRDPMTGQIIDDIDTRLEIFDAQGVLVASDSQTGFQTNAFTPWRSRMDSTFYVRVRSDEIDPAATDSAGDFTLTIDLRAKVVAMDPVTRRGAKPDGDPSDPTFTAGLADTSLFSFVTQGSGLDILTAVPLLGGPDIALRLYNEAGTLIQFDDGAAAPAEIQLELEANQRFFAVVEGFDDASAGPIGFFVEAHHTFDTSIPIDDHANLPDLSQVPTDPAQRVVGNPFFDAARRQFEQATPLVFDDAHRVADVSGNGLRDHGLVRTALADGRIHSAGDSDLFSFVPEINHLGQDPGDNDDEGTALYAGGSFSQIGDINVGNVGIFDGQDFFPAADAFNGTVLAMTSWDPDGAGPMTPVLVAGGTFDARQNDTDPNTLNGIAMWNGSAWLPMFTTGGMSPGLLNGTAVGTVRALTVYDADPNDTLPPALYVGGTFDTAGDGPASNIAAYQFDPGAGAFSWAGVSGGTDDTVRSLAVWDPPSEDQGGMTVDLGPQLIAGGDFIRVGPTTMNHIAQFGPRDDSMMPSFGWDKFGNGTDGPVNALTVYDPPPVDDGMGGTTDVEPVIVAGGLFTDADGVMVSNIAFYGQKISDDGMGGTTTTVEWQALAGGVNGEVFALTTFTPFDPTDPDGMATVPVLVAGGAFTQADGGLANRIAMWDNAAWSGLGQGFNNTVRSLVAFADLDEFPLPPFGMTINPIEFLYVGGDFTSSGLVTTSHIARYTFDTTLGGYTWQAMLGNSGGEGANSTVFALAEFDDGNSNTFDRHDLAASRVQIIASATTDGAPFLGGSGMFISVYDSNLNLIYSNETVSPIFPDPAGGLDPALAGPGADGNVVTVPMWAGQTYYVEVTASSPFGTGRYTLSVTEGGLDAADTDQDGVFTGPISTIFEGPGEGHFDLAPELDIGLGSGDAVRDVTPTVRFSPFLPPRNTITGSQERWFNFTPSGRFVANGSALPNIERIDDTDLYQFRAPGDGPGVVEIRINTTNLTNRFREVETDLTDPLTPITRDTGVITQTYNSPLDSVLRVFNNDQVQIATNDQNPAIGGETQTTFVGTFGNRTFFRRDARVLVPVVGGEVYFVQVESGQKAVFEQDPSKVDWRFATGTYELLLNAKPSLTLGDDHGAGVLSNATPIEIINDQSDPANGTGSIAGQIKNTVFNPADADLFSFTSATEGTVTLAVSRDAGQSLLPRVQVFDEQGQLLADGQPLPDGTVTLPLAGQPGKRFFVSISGNASTEGTYSISVTTEPFVDDHADFDRPADATPLTVLDFLGRASDSGSIESPGDTDLFMFTAEDFDVATVTLTSNASTLVPRVQVFEIGHDPANPANNEFLRIAFDSSATVAQTDFSTSKGLDYFVLVSGQDPDTHFGDYDVQVTFNATDDHADAGQFEFASLVVVDAVQGIGGITGVVEKAGDTDLFTFISPSSGKATALVGADLMTPIGQRIRPKVTVMDASGTVITTGTAGDSPFPSVQVEFDALEAQTYFVLVEGVSGSAFTIPTGAYNVTLNTPLDDHPNAGEFDIASVVALDPATGDGSILGAIEKGQDTDLFALDLPADGDLVVTVTSTFDAPRLRIFGTDQSQIDDQTAPNGQFSIGSSLAGLAAGRYFALVSPSAAGSISTGSYTLRVDGPPAPPDTGGIDDDHADAGQFDLATDLDSLISQTTGDGQISALIETPGDSDLFTFTSLATGRAFVQALTPKGTLHDVGVRIFGPDQVEIVSDSVGVPGANANASFQIDQVGQPYFVEVFGLSVGTGAYTLRLDTQPAVNVAYYPEGFSSPSIREFVSIANANDFAVDYRVIVRYAKASLGEAVVRAGTLAPGSRGGVAISDGKGGFAPGVIQGQAYALVVESDQGPVGATLAHYDFGTAIGESFTAVTSPTWTFPSITRQPGAVNDFVVVYNPNNTDSRVTLTATTADGKQIQLTTIIGAGRRGGWNINLTSILPIGTFAATITSEPVTPGVQQMGVVSALSHYDLVEGFGFGELGAPDGGATAGAIPMLTNGDGITASLSLFNPGQQVATVTLRGTYIDDALPELVRNLTIQPGQVLTLKGPDLQLVANQPIGLRYTSSVPVAVTASEIQGGDANATQAATQVAQTWFFGDAFINTAAAGTLYQESLAFYNPGNLDTTVTVTLFFSDKTEASFDVPVDADGFARVALHERSEILSRPGNNFFSIQVAAPVPFAAEMTHYDLFLAGGWSATGASLGLTNRIESI